MTLRPVELMVDVPDGAPTQRGTWVPVFGGEGGESNQQYHYQSGTYRILDGICHLWGYVQFAELGTITGNLILKGLPAPVGTIPHWVGGVSSYFSNPQPNGPPQLYFSANGLWDHFTVYGEPPSGQNPRQLTGADLNMHSQITFYLCYPID
jgi:hypothetical protein